MKEKNTSAAGCGVIKKGDPFAYLGHFMNKKFMSEGHNQGAPGMYGDQPKAPGMAPITVEPQPAPPAGVSAVVPAQPAPTVPARGVSAKPPTQPAAPTPARRAAPRRSNMPPATGGGASPDFKQRMAGDYQKNIAAGEAERSKLRAATQGLRTSQQAMRQAMPGAPRGGAKGQTSQYGRPRGGSRRGR